MARTMFKISLILIPLLCMGTSIEVKNWRYWPNIGCYEFSFERTVFFELTNEATRLSTNEGSELPAIVNSTIVPASDNELQLQHILAGSIRNSTTNTPEECIISCNATGFAYAGLQDGKRCVCMNEAPTAKTNGSNCNMGCAGNGSFSCGGSWTMDVHQNPAYHSTNLTYIGCYKNTFNDLDRMLFEGTYNNFRNNTPDWCVAFCTKGNYDYAGLQYGSQCICTNSGPQGTSDAGQCTYGCSGDSSIKMCGGLGYINIFHTDAHKTTIDDWGCGTTVQDTYYQKWYTDMGHCGEIPGGSGALPKEQTTEQHILMIAGGTRTEFLSLSPDDHPLPSCLEGSKGGISVGTSWRQNAALFPSSDGKILLCGGNEHTDDGRVLRYDGAADKWIVNSTVNIGAHTKQLWDFHPDVGLIVAGGRHPPSKKVEMSTDYGQTKTSLGDLPEGCNFVSHACMIIVNKTTVWVGGGNTDSGCYPNGGFIQKTHFLNLVTKQWTPGPDLTVPRQQFSCSLVTKPSPQIVIVGGRFHTNTWTNSVEIIDLDANTTTAIDAKIPVDGAIGQSSAITNGGDKVIVFGGFTGADAGIPNYDLYEYDAPTMAWTKLDGLQISRTDYGSAMFVDSMNICT